MDGKGGRRGPRRTRTEGRGPQGPLSTRSVRLSSGHQQAVEEFRPLVGTQPQIRDNRTEVRLGGRQWSWGCPTTAAVAARNRLIRLAAISVPRRVSFFDAKARDVAPSHPSRWSPSSLTHSRPSPPPHIVPHRPTSSHIVPHRPTSSHIVPHRPTSP
jgi:hypothetical protein